LVHLAGVKDGFAAGGYVEALGPGRAPAFGEGHDAFTEAEVIGENSKNIGYGQGHGDSFLLNVVDGCVHEMAQGTHISGDVDVSRAVFFAHFAEQAGEEGVDVFVDFLFHTEDDIAEHGPWKLVESEGTQAGAGATIHAGCGVEGSEVADLIQ